MCTILVDCGVCHQIIITAHWRGDDLIVTIQCPECGNLSSHSLCDLLEASHKEGDAIDQVEITCPLSDSVH